MILHDIPVLKFYKCYLDLWNGSTEVALASANNVSNALVECRILTSGLLILAIKCASAHSCILIIRLIKSYKGCAVTLDSLSTWAALVLWIQLFLSHSIVDLLLSFPLKGSVITNCICTFIIWREKSERKCVVILWWKGTRPRCVSAHVSMKWNCMNISTHSLNLQGAQL